MVRGPGASLTLEAKATREDTFKSKIGAGQAQAFFDGDRAGPGFYSAEVEERYTHKHSELAQSEVAIGASFANDSFTGSRLFPAVRKQTPSSASTRAQRKRSSRASYASVAGSISSPETPSNAPKAFSR